MRIRHIQISAAVSALLLSLASAASAGILWDQSNWNTNSEGSLNLSSNSCSQISGNTKLHNAQDVHFSNPVHITTVRIYETQGNVEAATQAYLWIAPKTGTLPTASSTDVNNAANLKPITISYQTVGSATAVVVTCANLDISLPPGDYWVSLTPKHSRGANFPYTVHLTTSGPVIGDPTATIEACTANSNWFYVLTPPADYAMLIEGDLPVPALKSSWGTIKTLYR